MKSVHCVVLLLAAGLMAGCVDNGDDPAGDRVDDGTQPGPGEVVMVTEAGAMVIELFCEAAPRTVQNFRQYAEDGFYEGTIFHRIINTATNRFVIQGGGFTADGTQKQTRAPIPLEPYLHNAEHTLSMARTGDPNSGTSQFFINLEDNHELDPRAGSAGYAVFGRVVGGTDTVETIADSNTGTGPRGAEDWPTSPTEVTEVRVGPPCARDTYGFTAGLIQDTQRDDGVWETTLSADVDHVPFWIHNDGDTADTIRAEVEAPAGWNVTVNKGSFDVANDHPLRLQPHPEATTGYLTIRYVGDDEMPDTTDTRFVLNLTSAGDPSAAKEIVVRPVWAQQQVDQVTAVGDQVEITYRGSFDSGDVFDEGTLPPAGSNFEVIVGGTGLVTGFSMGMLGLAVGETVEVRFPPDLGYGYHNPPAQGGQGHEQFNGEWLNFRITIDEIVT